ncbi:MAG: pitrilysin family protein [Ignavibacteria bacterium]|nr:pitrilysin family protein [Ignavibacteria bacterium]
MKILSLDYKKYSLQNGLEVILYQDKSLPIAVVNLWYNVGSSRDPMNKTGLAHLFEHMMFQGSKHVKKGEHFKFIQDNGGTLNASTSFDVTNYFEKIPSDFLETALWLESDRMGFFLEALTDETLANQIEVVKNERLERYDNQPYGLTWQKLFGLLYNESHPYHAPTIGLMDHILSYNQKDVSDFCNTYYQPRNASLVIAGDFEIDSAKDLVEKYFSGINSSAKVDPLNVEESELHESKSEVVFDSVSLEKILLVWKTEKIFHENNFALDILSDILTGSKNGRLHNILVLKQELALQVSAFQYSGSYGGFFCITATAKPGKSLDEIKKIIFEELTNLFTNNITIEELIRSKNGIKANFIYGMQSLDSVANHLNHYNFYLGEPNYFSHELSLYEKVERESVKNCAKYFNKPFIDLRFVPKEKEGKV